MGSQSGRKSTLLNLSFVTGFREMDCLQGRFKTTRGIWIAKAAGIHPCTLVLNLEGSDGREKGEVAILGFRFDREQFDAQVENLRQQFIYSTAPGGLADRDTRDVIGASGFSFSVQQVWEVIRENKDLDLPSHRVMVVMVHCEQISNEAFCIFAKNKDWLRLEEAAQGGPLPDFESKLSSLIRACLSGYDAEAKNFNEGVSISKQKQLGEKLLQLVQPAFLSVLGHMKSTTLDEFEKAFIHTLRQGSGFQSAVRSCSQHYNAVFDEACKGAVIEQAMWDTSRVRENLLRDMDAYIDSARSDKISELTRVYEVKLGDALAGPVEALLDEANAETSSSIRELPWHETESAVFDISGVLSDLGADERITENILARLRDYTEDVVEKKAKDRAGRVSILMKDRNSMRGIWTGKEDIPAVKEAARSASLKLPSVRLADHIEGTLSVAFSTVFDSLTDFSPWEEGKRRRRKEMMKMMMKIIFIMLVSVYRRDMFVRGQEIPGFISIDCGVANNYSDATSRIYYETDKGYVDTGENRQVSTDNLSINDDARSKNMRIFPNGTRNCYTLRPKQGKGNKYLIRGSFSYGNYDGRNVTPVFDIHIDTNFWFTADGFNYYCQEIIYIPSRDYMQFCLINTGNGIPFISAIELRLLEGDLYPFDSGAIVQSDRNALGMPAASLRYPEDAFDRIWYQYSLSSANAVSNTTTLEIDPNSNPYKVPIGVLENAQVLSDKHGWKIQSNSTDNWYIYLYFAEIQDLQQNQSREFSVYVDNTVVVTESLQLSMITAFQSQKITGQTTITFGLSPTAQSTLSPILNAFETYKVLDLPNPMTTPGDFDAINNVRAVYELVQTEYSWQGDPCIPAIYMWSRLICSNISIPSIVSLNLSSSGLTGSIAPAFANLTSLESLDLSNNQLTGPVPKFFAQMPSLKILNLSRNNLNGSVPRDLLKKKADRSLLLSLDGNPNLCNSTSCPAKGSSGARRSIIVPIVASTLSVIVVVLLVAIIVIWTKVGKSNDGSTMKISRNRVFRFSELKRITENFETVVGEGGFGKVYLGKLKDRTEVAVKVLSRSSRQGYREFEAEAKLLMVVHHRNLVNLVGYCDDPENMALVYEYMSNGNVRNHLSKNSGQVLSWPQRLQIAVNAAQGLEYLHCGCRPSIIHRDLKTANILLDENMQAKIADFGLSRAFATDFDSHISTIPGGTPGYLDPEFQTSGNLNQKSDVYSFGIILFELITGHPAIIKGEEKLIHILHWVTPLIRRCDIESIMDPRLHGEFKVSSAWKAVEVAMSCVPAIAVQRPDMSHVLLELKECMALEVVTPQSQQIGISKRSYSFETSSLDFGMSPNAR